jgi:hypothetical protein
MASRQLFFLTTTALVLVAAAAAPAPAPADNVLQPVAAACSTGGNYTDGSQYRKNLEELLAAMPSAAVGNGWFYTGTAGAGGDRVQGLLACYADRDAAQCQDCLARAPAGVASVCTGSRRHRRLRHHHRPRRHHRLHHHHNRRRHHRLRHHHLRRLLRVLVRMILEGFSLFPVF